MWLLFYFGGVLMISTTKMKCWKQALLAAVVTMAPAQAWAGDFYSTVPYTGTVKLGGTGATPADKVIGKEYSHNRIIPTANDPNGFSFEDHDAFATPDPLQNVSWDGISIPGLGGGNSGSTDAFDYDHPNLANTTRQVDAIANRGDFLFRQTLVNQSALLFSTTGDFRAGADVHVMWEDPTGGFGPWAVIETNSTSHPPGPGPGVNHHNVFDVDGLEVWGPEPPSHTNPNADPVNEGYAGGVNTADADRFSLDRDSASGTAVWGYDIPTGNVFPWVSHAAVVQAVESAFLPNGGVFTDEVRRLIDLDALMAQDLSVSTPRPVVGFAPGDELLFSIDPIPQAGIDGGEILHMSFTAAGGILGVFLSHGGHLWDTAFDVRGKFGTEFEDIDVLEAVGTLTGDFEIPVPDPLIPEPSTWALALIALGGVMLRKHPSLAT
jgi:hypothetical protein